MKRSGCFSVALFVALCVSMFVNLLLLAVLGVKGSGGSMSHVHVLQEAEYDEEVLVKGDPGSKIAVIPLEGIIAFGHEGSLGDSMVEDFKAALEQAANDPKVKAVVVQIDSPGGEVTASDVLYEAMRTFPEEKPMVAYFNAIGASGAYYAACGADWIMCNHTTFTGSIGVIISTLNYRELFGKVGLESLVFKSGKFKDMLNGAREMTPAEKEYVQALVMQSYERFLGIVAESRKLDPAALRDGPADGRIMSGTDALRDRLVDQLGYIEDAYGKAGELASTTNPTVVRYLRTYNIGKFLRLFGETRSAGITIDLPGMSETRLEPGRVYLLPPFFAP